jgi:hypothetical protein
MYHRTIRKINGVDIGASFTDMLIIAAENKSVLKEKKI